MLLDSNTERVMDLVDMVDDLNGIYKIRIAIHLLEEHYFSTKYDESFIRLLKEVLENIKQKSTLYGIIIGILILVIINLI